MTVSATLLALDGEAVAIQVLLLRAHAARVRRGGASGALRTLEARQFLTRRCRLLLGVVHAATSAVRPDGALPVAGARAVSAGEF